MSKTTVVFLLWNNLKQISGVTSWVCSLRPRLEERGYNTKVAVERPDVAGIDGEGIDLVCFHPEDLFHKLLEWSPCVVVAMNIDEHAGYAYAVDRASRNGAKAYLISVLHADSRDEYYDPLNRFDRYCHRFIAVSERIRVEIERRLPWRSSNVTVLPCSVDCPSTIARLERKGPLRICYAGRVIQQQKRVLDFVLLVRELNSRGIDYVLTIVGDGPDLPQMKSDLKGAADVGRVVFAGHLPKDRMPGVWLGNDVFINVSAFEGTSVSMLEAMAAGCVPVVSDVSGVGEVIRYGKNGYFAGVGDISGFADRIIMLDRDRGALKAMSAAAHDTILRNYSIESYAQNFSSILNGLIVSDPLVIPGQFYRSWRTLADGSVVSDGVGKVKVYTIYTDEHKALMERWLLRTMRDEWPVQAFYAGSLGGQDGSNFGSGPYYDLLKRRVNLLIGTIRENWGSPILWIDTDVQFFGRFSKLVEDTLKNYDIAFQSEWSHLSNRCHREVCCGVMAMRCNDAVLTFWEYVNRLLCDRAMEFPHGDQSAVNYVLDEGLAPIRYTVFDSRIWAMSHGNYPQIDTILHHANCTESKGDKSSFDLKIEQLEDVGLFVDRIQMNPLKVCFTPFVAWAKHWGMKHVACWPAGLGGRMFIELAKEWGVQVEAVVDSNQKLWGSEIDNVPVVSPAEMLKINLDGVAITSLTHAEVIIEAIHSLYEASGKIPNILLPSASFYRFSNQVRYLKGVSV